MMSKAVVVTKRVKEWDERRGICFSLLLSTQDDKIVEREWWKGRNFRIYTAAQELFNFKTQVNFNRERGIERKASSSSVLDVHEFLPLRDNPICPGSTRLPCG